jgi:hypothetical protein
MVNAALDDVAHRWMSAAAISSEREIAARYEVLAGELGPSSSTPELKMPF